MAITVDAVTSNLVYWYDDDRQYSACYTDNEVSVIGDLDFVLEVLSDVLAVAHVKWATVPYQYVEPCSRFLQERGFDVEPNANTIYLR